MFPLQGYQSHWENISVYMCCELMTWSYAHLGSKSDDDDDDDDDDEPTKELLACTTLQLCTCMYR